MAAQGIVGIDGDCWGKAIGREPGKRALKSVRRRVICSSLKADLLPRERERERERQTDRQTETETERDRERLRSVSKLSQYKCV